MGATNRATTNRDALSSFIIAVPPVEYDRATLYGNASFDKLRIVNRAPTITELDNISITDDYSWSDSDMILYADFEQSLVAGQIDSDEPIDTYSLFRTETGSSDLKEIVTGLSDDISNYTDYTAYKDKIYSYLLSPKTENNKLIAALTSNSVTFDYFSIILIDLVTEDYLILELDTNRKTSKTNTKHKIYDMGFNTYSRLTKNNSRSDILSVSARLGAVNCTTYEYEETLETLEKAKEIINNKNDKIIKFSRGDVLKVNTYNFSDKRSNKVAERLSTISFNVLQVGDV